MAKLRKYGALFDIDATDDDGNQIYDDLGIEMYFIRKGDAWLREHGRTLSFHYENARKIIWPELDSHRWHHLCRDSLLENKIAVLMGCASSGKTHTPAWMYLLEYWCFPDETCVLVSSTTMPSLKKRVWAEITMLWERGVERFPKLSGHLLDSATAITTDNVEDCEPGQRKARDMRKGIFGIACVIGGKQVGLSRYVGIKQKRMRLIADEACFPAGTMIDTPSGRKPIESLSAGDEVWNCLGVSKIKHTFKKKSTRLVHITTESGNEITCTPTHPVFTQDGWKNACHLSEGDVMVTTYEAMRIMRRYVHTEGDIFRQVQSMPGQGANLSLQGVRESFREAIPEIQSSFLLSKLLIETSPKRSPLQEEVLHQGSVAKNPSVSEETLFGAPRAIRSDEAANIRGDGAVHGISFSRAEAKASQAFERNNEAARSQAEGSGRQRNRPNPGGEGFEIGDFGTDMELRNQDETARRERIPVMLQGGPCDSRTDAGDRGRWELSQHGGAKSSGHQKDGISFGDRVVGVAFYEQEDFRGHKLSGDGIEVYNLEIEGHPSYSVNGFLVHNSMMADSFLSAFANLNNNEDFRACILGNPHDITDPLGKAAEPKDGWDENTLEPPKTTTWKTRFMNGICVNLVGTDSPNFDFPPDQPTRYKYLISKEKIADTLSFFPKDSVEFFSMARGVMKIGTVARRVLTRNLCDQNDAQKEPIWADDKQTVIYFVDSSYGGDRCVAGSAKFGREVGGKVVLAFRNPKIIPIMIGRGEPEQQIAEFVKADCEDQDIPGSHMGHDSTGRGGLGTALAKAWSADTHPIDSGGRPTKRPVSLDMQILDDDTGLKRPKRCEEHYDRLVTEFWFSVRYAVEAGQIRGLPDEAMDELCSRKWDKIRGDKIAVEVKDGTPNKPGYKQRMGKSPDMGDWAAGIVEMARRKGFQISKLSTPEAGLKKKSDWFANEAKRLEEARKSRQLVAV